MILRDWRKNCRGYQNAANEGRLTGYWCGCSALQIVPNLWPCTDNCTRFRRQHNCWTERDNQVKQAPTVLILLNKRISDRDEAVYFSETKQQNGECKWTGTIWAAVIRRASEGRGGRKEWRNRGKERTNIPTLLMVEMRLENGIRNKQIEGRHSAHNYTW